MSHTSESPMCEFETVKEKVSLRLPVEIMEKLEGIVYHAKREIPRAKAKQLTKSKLTELIIQAIIREYEEGKGKGIVTSIVAHWAEN